jgi:hypothetical protein
MKIRETDNINAWIDQTSYQTMLKMCDFIRSITTEQHCDKCQGKFPNIKKLIQNAFRDNR